PSFGVALIGRLLESHGFRVAILSQPRFDSAADFKTYPTPKLFCGITAGNLDSIVANYTGNGKVRNSDSYSPNGNPWRGNERIKTERRRPDRACLIYTSLARSAFKDIPIVLGGIEASLRRFVHYDFKQDKLRSSFLTDAKADLVVYGMAEKAIVEIAMRCAQKRSLFNIAGTCQRFTDNELQQVFPTQFPDLDIKSSQKFLVLPSWEKIQAQAQHFLEAETEID
ncbi:MAG: YgiQ family radical SAM protein, partial [bacterium]|nr:YgiQ family radical SAM protein [bacterium]